MAIIPGTTSPFVKIRITMKVYKLTLIVVLIFLSTSCNVRRGIVKDAPVKLVRPDKVVSLSADTTLKCAFSEALNCYSIHIVRDSILILYVQVTDEDPYHFKAYSTETFDYLGAFVREGRGPGEMVSPHIAKNDTGAEYLGLNDNQTGKACLVDVIRSISNNNTEIVRSYDLPSGVLDWLPLSDVEDFVLQQDGDEMLYRLIRSDDNSQQIFHPYEGIRGKGNITYFSSLFTMSGISGKVAEVMIFFPQINFLDTENGRLYSVAVDRSYRKWESVLCRMMDMSTVQYYDGVTSNQDYVFAIYKGLTFSDMNKAGQGCSIHVFDWAGHFLCEIKISENLIDIAYDSSAELMYGLDSEEDIVRYDLSEIL